MQAIAVQVFNTQRMYELILTGNTCLPIDQLYQFLKEFHFVNTPAKHAGSSSPWQAEGKIWWDRCVCAMTHLLSP